MKENDIWIVLIITVGMVIVSGAALSNMHYAEAFKNGYCEVQRGGSSSTMWIKCEVSK